MEDKTLTININQAGRQALIDVKEKIIIIRSYDDEAETNIVCESFAPFGDVNTIEFKNSWHEYASISPMINLQVINMQETTPVKLGNTYKFMNSGFNGIEGSCPTNYYGFSNQQTNDKKLVAGMAQFISVNNSNSQLAPTSAYNIPSNQTIYFGSTSNIIIFVAQNLVTGTIIPQSMLSPDTAEKSITIGKYLKIDLDTTTEIFFNEKNTHLSKIWFNLVKKEIITP